ncbi:MAG: glycosyltransferase family 2 protein [Tannerellaceae bacterium]|nr:glycosyltransferase family 2 protein [Tannerellaceae bacterium]
MIRFSVILPIYNQEEFVRRAILSLFQQTHTAWELIIINDGSTDHTEECLQDILADNRIRYIKNATNKGLGYALNQGIDIAQYDYIAYLPADDYYFRDHLETLAGRLKESEEIILVYSCAQSKNNDSTGLNFKQTTTNSLFDRVWLQLVQVAHRKTVDRWVERSEFVTEDLFKMFWYKLTGRGIFSSITKVTANWTTHPFQRHKHICERYGGGINIYRQYYNVQEPIKLKMSEYRFIDEEKLYKQFRVKNKSRTDGLKILIVGDLAFNSERICALEEDGHRLYGIWTQRPSMSFSMVGPLPFGNIEDIPFENWEERVREIQPDVIYALLNHEAIDTTYEVLKKNLGIPFVWHFKEGPFLALMKGQWKKLFELFNEADARIFINEECKEWFNQFLYTKRPSLVIDGDLPKSDYFTNDFSPLLSAQDGEIHTVIPGRIVGVSLEDIAILAANKIHIHIYLETYFEKRFLLTFPP